MILPPFVSCIVIALIQQPSQAQNPERIETVRSYKLEFFENGKLYAGARTACEARDAWLVEIKDEEIFDAVYRFKRQYAIWIGAFYSSRWTWNGKVSLRYANWTSGNPTKVEGKFVNHCGLMPENGQWRNIDCTKTYRYVCQRDLNYPGSFSLTFVTTPKKSFNDAKTACTAMTAASSRLVEIKTSALNSLINRNISDKTVQYWTSGNDIVREGEWKWGDGNSINKSSINWITSADGRHEPSGIASKNCLATNISGWADELCTKANGYICQENITSGQCEEEVCSNRGICAISNTRYRCSCDAGYFGTKCEKDLITISPPTPPTSLQRGQSLTVTVTVKSYDKNVNVFYRKAPDEGLTDKQITIPRPGSSANTELSLGIQLENATYYFDVRPQSQPETYSRTVNISITIIGLCKTSPCMNGGTCKDTMSEPYYTCTCKFDNEGLRCERNRSFVAMGNCKYHMMNETLDFVNATRTCARLDKEGSLAMAKNPSITNFLGEAIRSQFKIVDQWLWVGGEQFKHDWFWLDGTTINNTAPWQIWDNREHQYLVVRLPSEDVEMRWSSKNGSETAEGYICEVPVQNPCNLTNCANGGICVSVGCQANCNCTPGFDEDLCENDRITINADQTNYTTVQNQSVKVKLSIWSNHGPVKIEVLNESNTTRPIFSRRNVTKSTTFTLGPMYTQTESIQYIFRASPEADTESYYKQTSVNITVEGPPSVTINGSDVLVIPSEANITVECYASSVPTPSVTWKKDGVELPTEDSESVYQSKAPNYTALHLASTARTQVGYYTCYAENYVNGNTRMAQDRVSVRGKIRLVQNNTILSESASDINTISCTFEGYPSPNIGWKWKNDNILPDKAGSVFKWHTVVDKESPLVQETSTLNINLPEYLGSTQVSCNAWNEYENSTNTSFPLNQNLLIKKTRSYRIYADERMTHADAETHCESIGRSLMKISNNETQRFIAEELSRRNITTDVFVGAKKDYSPDGIELWKWHDGELLYNMTKHGGYLPNGPITDDAYTAWNGSDVNETGRNCLALKNDEQWSWVPTRCDSKIGFICESEGGGIPTNLEVSVEKCQASFNFSWTANKQALGVEHRVEVSKGDNNSLSTDEILKNVFPTLERFDSLQNASVYDIKVTVCPKCPSPSTISTTALIPTLIQAENRRIGEANVTRHGQSCMFSWSVDNPLGITGFKVTSLVKLVHTASTKGRMWSDGEEFEANPSTTQYSVPMHYNRNYTFSIQIRTCLNLGESKHIYESCIAERGPPTFVPEPLITTTANSREATVQFSYPDETNGPISCLFIITTGTLSDSNGTIFGMNELLKASENSKSDTYDPSSPYVSIAISRSIIAATIEQGETFITRTLGEGDTVSSCDITADYSSRKKRDVPETTVIKGSNRKLSAGETVSIFIVSTTPGDNGEVFVKTSKTSSVSLPSLQGGMVAGIVIAIIVTVALAVVTAFLVKRKRDSNKIKSLAITMPQFEEEEQEEEHAYANFGFNNREPKSKTEISIDQLKPIYNSMKSRNSEDFREEFQELKEDAKSLTYPTQVASAASVTMKNRYRNILPSDRSRVVLNGEGDSTYINACYINGYSKNKKFIAAQGPLPNTVNDFWRMVSEQKCAVIVMLANCVENGRIKCEKYWPDRGVLKFYGDVNVSNVKENSYGGYKIREFQLTKDDEEITVHQYHFLSWPDHGVPVTTTNLMRFYNAVVKHQMKSAPDSPIVVHCSAGAGRTGTFIAYDYLLEQKEATSYVDIYGCVMNLRGQRVDMVQSCDQYILLHKLMLENCLLGETDMDAASFGDLIQRDSEGKNKLRRQFDKLSLVGPVNQMKHGDVPRNRAMNRNGDTVPYESNRVIILKQVDEMDVPYLNASTIETYGSFIKLFAAQGPMKSSVEYFWRAVIDSGITTIVMLTQTMENKKEQCFQYWPESSDKDVLVKDIVVHLESESADESIIKREFTVSRGDDRRTVKQYQYLQWTSDKCPEDPGIVLDLVKKVSENPSNKIGDGTIVHCSDGAGRTGAFCAILSLIGRLKSENKIDIFRTVKDLRDCRPGMVQTYEHLLFCHMAVSAYMKTTDDE